MLKLLLVTALEFDNLPKRGETRKNRSGEWWSENREAHSTRRRCFRRQWSRWDSGDSNSAHNDSNETENESSGDADESEVGKIVRKAAGWGGRGGARRPFWEDCEDAEQAVGECESHAEWGSAGISDNWDISQPRRFHAFYWKIRKHPSIFSENLTFIFQMSLLAS